MLITRKTKVPLSWVFYAQLVFTIAIASNIAIGAPFLFAMKRFIDNPAAITFLLSIESMLIFLSGPFCNWLSDHVWTRFGRRRPFIVIANVGMALCVALMPFAPDLWTLIALRWIYGLVGALAAPNQALTMEVIPARQRGMGSGFFKFQFNIVNIFFWGVVIGRFDDIYISGPFEKLFAVPGEHLLFAACALLMVTVALFTWFGIHEVEPPDRRRVRDERRPGENLARTFARVFFKDVFSKSLLPLYMLCLVSTMFGVGLGTLAPLLYTDQWGYSIQEMGTNIAIGAPLGMVIAIVAGWLADRTSKFRVYTLAMVCVCVFRTFWTVFVMLQPGHRPELYQIILFGTLQDIFALVAGAASFPLILEYVERNRLGTAGAGMGIFNAIVTSLMNMGVGVYLVAWSVLFLPQAGDRLEVVFNHPVKKQEVRADLAAGGIDTGPLTLQPLHRPGVAGAVSRHWLILNPVAGGNDDQKRLKTIGTGLADAQLKLQRPGLSAAARAKVDALIARLDSEQSAIQARLDASAADFRRRILRAIGPDLAPEGGYIRAASVRDDGDTVAFTLAFVEPTDADISRKTLWEGLTFTAPPKDRDTVPADLKRDLDGPDLAHRPVRAGPVTTYVPELEVTPLSAPVNAMRIVLHRDPRFVALESALVREGIDWTAAYSAAASLLPPLQGLAGQQPGDFSISAVQFTNADQPRLAFDLRFNHPGKTTPAAAALDDTLSTASDVKSANVTGAAPLFHVALALDAKLAAASRAQVDASPAADRLRALLPGATPAEIATAAGLVGRIVQTAAAAPTFLTATRPVVVSRPADRQYDYFLPVQIIMFISDLFAFFVLWLIVRLEKRGVIKRYGALEDANR